MTQLFPVKAAVKTQIFSIDSHFKHFRITNLSLPHQKLAPYCNIKALADQTTSMLDKSSSFPHPLLLLTSVLILSSRLRLGFKSLQIVRPKSCTHSASLLWVLHAMLTFIDFIIFNNIYLVVLCFNFCWSANLSSFGPNFSLIALFLDTLIICFLLTRESKFRTLMNQPLKL